MIDIFLVPLGRNRFEPYFEPLDGEAAVTTEAGVGWIARIKARFAGMIRDAEERRHDRALHDREADVGFLSRMQRRLMSVIAERVAEQRLLWKLRGADEAMLHVPANLSAEDAERRLRAVLKREETFHFRRMILHGLAMIAATPLVVLPGPNVVGLFFLFTFGSHFLSYRGARRGLSPALRWSFAPSAALDDLQTALTLDFSERHQRIHAIGEQLRLRRLPTFVERMIAATA